MIVLTMIISLAVVVTIVYCGKCRFSHGNKKRYAEDDSIHDVLTQLGKVK